MPTSMNMSQNDLTAPSTAAFEFVVVVAAAVVEVAEVGAEVADVDDTEALVFPVVGVEAGTAAFV